MAAITKRLLHLRPTFHSHASPYPYTLHQFSSSSDRDDVPQSEQPQKQSSDSSSLNAVRASLRNLSPPPDRRRPPGSPFSFSSGETPQPSRDRSKDEISSRLAEFRSRSAPPPPHPGGQYVSLEKLYENSISSNGESSTASSGLGAGGRQSVDSIRESMSNLHPTGAVNPGMNLSGSWKVSRYTKNKADPNANLAWGSGNPISSLMKGTMEKRAGDLGSRKVVYGMTHDLSSLGEKLKTMRPENLKNKADPNANLAWGSGNPISSLMKGTMEKRAGDLGSRKVVYGMTHDLSSLGEKLKTMRPEKRKGKWFSLQELSDRLAKVKVADEKELERAGFARQYFQKLAQDKNQQKKDMARNCKHIILLGSMDAETGPPKDHLVEKYFHPDNMSSAEKMKLELQKVRDEFKMSESDCGSARVQVAQLTTKIKHLSTALHKKDKHSRKGLHEMVQRRKKLLKYLRRTDWDSYCLVLSKLGLRDNPDIKA